MIDLMASLATQRLVNIILNIAMMVFALGITVVFAKERQKMKSITGIGASSIKRMQTFKVLVAVSAVLQSIAALLGDLLLGDGCTIINHIQPFIYVMSNLFMYLFLFQKQRLTKVIATITVFEKFVLFLMFLEFCFAIKVLILMFGAEVVPGFCFIIAAPEDPILMFCLDTTISLLLLWTFVKPLLAELDKRKSGASNKVFLQTLRQNMVCCLGAVFTTLCSMLLFVAGQQLMDGAVAAGDIPMMFNMLVLFKSLNFTTTFDITMNTLFIYLSFRRESKTSIPQENGSQVSIDSTRGVSTMETSSYDAEAAAGSKVVPAPTDP